MCGHIYAVEYYDECASNGNCPCTSSLRTTAYAFINNNYYCESGVSPGTGISSKASY